MCKSPYPEQHILHPSIIEVVSDCRDLWAYSDGQRGMHNPQGAGGSAPAFLLVLEHLERKHSSGRKVMQFLEERRYIPVFVR